MLMIYFFSSRRRHTRYWRDWSSDVCSSDLIFRDLPFTDRIAATMAAGPDTVEFWGWRNKDLDAIRAACEEQIGRASCRVRVEISVVAVSLKKNILNAKNQHLIIATTLKISD